MRLQLGPVDGLPTDRCVAVDDGRFIVFRVGSEVHVWPNRCLHQDTPLAGGWIRDGVLTCPAHFWRYELPSGRLIGSDQQIEQLPVTIIDGQAVVTVPDPPPARSIREQLLDHARQWNAEER